MWAPNYTRRDTASKTPRDEAWVRPRVRGRRACARGALHRKGRQRNGRGRLRRDRQGREPAPGAYLLHRGELVLGEGGDHGTASEHGVRRCEVAHRTGAHPGEGIRLIAASRRRITMGSMQRVAAVAPGSARTVRHNASALGREALHPRAAIRAILLRGVGVKARRTLGWRRGHRHEDRGDAHDDRRSIRPGRSAGGRVGGSANRRGGLGLQPPCNRAANFSKLRGLLRGLLIVNQKVGCR